MTHSILQVDSSARGSFSSHNGSLSRELTKYLSEALAKKNQTEVIYRDLAATPLEFVNESLIGAYYTPAENRSEEQKQSLSLSDELISELKAVNTLIIGAPIYNFSVPAALKAWIDLVCRVGETFRYGEAGPEGLLDIDQAFIVTSAGGTAIGSEIDFNSSYLQKICRFIGVKESHVIDVSGSKRDPDTLIDYAKQQIEKFI
jgi:FMN-dependent NADH-azoreductase